jgi:hypothetical protein
LILKLSIFAFLFKLVEELRACAVGFIGGLKHWAVKHSLCAWGSYMLCVVALLSLKGDKAFDKILKAFWVRDATIL